MVRKRPCRICRRWFQPNPRAGDRQRVCSHPECQKERRRRSVAALREKDPDYERADRLRGRLRTGEALDEAGPLAGLDRQALRNAVGLEVSVAIEESIEVAYRVRQRLQHREESGFLQAQHPEDASNSDWKRTVPPPICSASAFRDTVWTAGRAASPYSGILAVGGSDDTQMVAFRRR